MKPKVRIRIVGHGQWAITDFLMYDLNFASISEALDWLSHRPWMCSR